MGHISPSEALDRPFVGDDTYIKKSGVDPHNENNSTDYHGFHIGDLGLLIPKNMISEVAEKLPFCELPNTSMILYGMANLRGNIIPIFDLYELFGLDSINKASHKILIIGRGEDAVALLINDLPILVSVAKEHELENKPPIPDLLQPYTRKCYQNNGIWLEVVDEFFTTLGIDL